MHMDAEREYAVKAAPRPARVGESFLSAQLDYLILSF